VERSLYPQYVLEQAGGIRFDQGDLLELLGVLFNDHTAVSMQWLKDLCALGKRPHRTATVSSLLSES